MVAIAIIEAEKLSKRSIAVAGLKYRFVRAYATGIANDLSGSVAKVGVASDPKRVGPASRNLEYG